MEKHLPLLITLLAIVIGLNIFSLKSFQRQLVTLIILIAFHLFNRLYYHLEIPVGLLYGPYIYILTKLFYKEKVGWKSSFLHGLPFLLFSGLFLLLYYLDNQYLNSFYDLYLITTGISLLTYPQVISYIRKKKKKWTRKNFILTQIKLTYSVIGILFFLKILDEHTDVNYGFNIVFLIYTILGISLLFLVSYITYWKSRANSRGVPDEKYKNIDLDESLMELYKEKVYEVLEHSRLYLNPNLSLDILAKATSIPKHHFSPFFNVYMEKSFYRFLAEYRIKYAIQTMKEKSNIKLEALAYESGFSSKTSFNKYFKEITGSLPSQFKLEEENVAIATC